MAGSNPDFDAAAFREAMLFTFAMAAAPDPSEQATFGFPRNTTTSDPVDADGVPFAADAVVSYDEPTPVVAPCIVEYFDNNGQPANALGIIQPTTVRVTLLDEQYALVEGCNRVTIDGDTYRYRRTEPPSGLFDVGIYVLHFAADSET